MLIHVGLIVLKLFMMIWGISRIPSLHSNVLILIRVTGQITADGHQKMNKLETKLTLYGVSTKELSIL